MNEWETVHSMLDYYDGPRKGVADYLGKPHYYESRWDEAKQDWEGEWQGEEFVDHYWLSPIDSETFTLACEKWQIWLRWEAAFHNGETDESTHPAMPQERERSEELERQLADRLRINEEHCFRAAGVFRLAPDAPLGRLTNIPLQVRWSRLPS